MALIKSKTLPNGATGTYWRITSSFLDTTAMQCTWTITLFTNKTIADATPTASLGYSKTFAFPITKGESKCDIRAQGYNMIKAYANVVIAPAIPAVAAQVGPPAVAAKAAVPAVYQDNDLAQATNA